MMKISSVFLHMLLVFLIMEEVLGDYYCYHNRFGIDKCLENSNQSLIGCWHNAPINLIKVQSTDDCTTATFIDEYDKKYVMFENTSSAEDYCKNKIPHFKERELEYTVGMTIKDYNCTHCHEDRCNENKVTKEKRKEKQGLGKNDGNQVASNNTQKPKLTRNEARNQVLSNPTIVIITFISLLVCLML